MSWRVEIIVATLSTLLTLPVNGLGQPFYTVVAPSFFRENSNYSMSFATIGLNVAMKMRVTLSFGSPSQTQIVEVPPNKPIVNVFEVSFLFQYLYLSISFKSLRLDRGYGPQSNQKLHNDRGRPRRNRFQRDGLVAMEPEIIVGVHPNRQSHVQTW
jgi:hypothetical protein